MDDSTLAAKGTRLTADLCDALAAHATAMAENPPDDDDKAAGWNAAVGEFQRLLETLRAAAVGPRTPKE